MKGEPTVTLLGSSESNLLPTKRYTNQTYQTHQICHKSVKMSGWGTDQSGRFYGAEYSGVFYSKSKEGIEFYAFQGQGRGYIWSPAVAGFRELEPLPINYAGGKELQVWQSNHRQRGPVWGPSSAMPSVDLVSGPFVCPHPRCGEDFETSKGLGIHITRRHNAPRK